MKLDAPFIGTLGAGCCRLKTRVTLWLLLLVQVVGFTVISCAQMPTDEKNSSVPSPKPKDQSADVSLPPVDLRSLPRNLFTDQTKFWSAPFHMSQSEWQWTVPLAFVGAGLLASDTAIEKHVPTNTTTVSHSVTASNAGLGAMAGARSGRRRCAQSRI